MRGESSTDLWKWLMATLQGSAQRQRQQGSHMPLPLQGLDLSDV